MSEKIDLQKTRETQAETMVRFLGRVKDIDILKDRTLEQVLETEATKRDFIEHLSDQDFMELLNGINGLIRGKEKDDWKMDGQGVVLDSLMAGNHIPPRYEDKEQLLKDTFREARAMAGESRTLEDIATLLSASINEVHPYLDANGRTSRFVYTLLTKDYKGVEPELKNVLGERGRDYIDISPSWLNKYIENVVASELGIDDKDKNPKSIIGWHYQIRPLSEVKFKEVVSDKEKDDFLALLHDDYMGAFFALFEYAHNLPELEKYVKSYPNRNVIMADWLIPDLSPSDIGQITQKYWAMKKRYTEILIDLVAHPEKPEYGVKEEDTETTILNLFKDRVREEAVRKEEKRAE